MLRSSQWLHLWDIICTGFSGTLYQMHREKCEKCKIPSALKTHSHQCRRLTGGVLEAINYVLLQLIQNKTVLHARVIHLNFQAYTNPTFLNFLMSSLNSSVISNKFILNPSSTSFLNTNKWTSFHCQFGGNSPSSG